MDFFTASGIYERAITEAASQRFKGEPGAEQTLRSFWTGYLDAAVSSCLNFIVDLYSYSRSN